MRRLARVAVGLLATGVLAGCGGSSGSTSHSGSGATAAPSSTSAPATPTATAAAAPKPARRGSEVQVGPTRYGRILLDGSGKALYLFTADRGNGSRCSGQCAVRWPPYLTAAAPIAAGTARSAALGTVRRRDGALQVTYRGHPLYHYIDDRRAGEVLCQDVEEFGGHWYVVAASGAAVR